MLVQNPVVDSFQRLQVATRLAQTRVTPSIHMNPLAGHTHSFLSLLKFICSVLTDCVFFLLLCCCEPFLSSFLHIPRLYYAERVA
jgi:hypothetical protein